MLKFSSIFLLLCGLLALSCAEEVLDEIRQKLISGTFSASGNFTSNHGWWWHSLLTGTSNLQSLLGGQVLSGSSQVKVQVKEPRFLGVSLESTPRIHEANLKMPVSFELHLQSPFFPPSALRMRSDMKVQLNVQKDPEGRYGLIFGNCRLLPEYVQMQPASLTRLISNLAKNIGSHLRSTIAHNMGEMMCPVIDEVLSHLNQREASEITDKILQQDNGHATIEISSK